MAMVESLQRAIDYMEEHLLEPITIEEISRQANVSPFHFQRTFTILTDVTVGEYLRRRRLTLAAQELSTTDCKIIDLAYKYGYDTPEAFSKAFRKQHGVTPSEVRKGAGRLQSYNRLTIQVSLKGAEPMKYRIVERDVFQVVGVKRECPCGEEAKGPGIAGFWGEAHGNGTVDKLIPLMNGEIKGLLGITDNYNAEKSTIDYWIAAEHAGEVSSGLESIQIPASKWAVFEVRGHAPTAMVNAWRQIYSEWVPSNGYELAEIAAIEAYIDPDPYSQDSLNEIWLAIK
ncbi:AraC family transcriptional regulator [Paenibacillus sp. UNCCL117]|uniref:AraC family transcriptional regulator n=1 Tax=unclassified Paenibacillus TaxID=185978 RepID=UPI00088D4588|nr:MULTISPECIES: AraC family transcriptional regulator [unclassified Paenibacillus]SDD16478.1 transcriptional regulator, AraC family [Paenibacillus sp. cl123]SFW34723.1 AraC family transcriptional regulator [Paenibacillus sp. UNCCL117]